MENDALKHILERNPNRGEVLTLLAERLNPQDLQSLLLAVYHRRAAQQSPAGLLEQYVRSRFNPPAKANPFKLLEFDLLAYQLSAPVFQPVELSPVGSLGASSVLAPVDQNSVIATIRNGEVVSDPTNILALECAVRRRELLKTHPQSTTRVNLSTSQRIVRAQHYDRPGLLAHFRLFALTTAGRDEGGFRFELDALCNHIDFYLRLLLTLKERGTRLEGLRVLISDFSGEGHSKKLASEVINVQAARYPQVNLALDNTRQAGRGYYAGVCFYVHARDSSGKELNLVDGGFTDWTQQLISSQKERLLISGIGTERASSL